MLVWLSKKEKPFSTLSASFNHLNIWMKGRMWFIVLVAIPVTSATLVRLSNFSPLEDTSTNMQLDVCRKPMVLHSTFSRTKNTRLIGRTEFSWILSRIGEKGRLKKRFLLTALTLELLWCHTRSWTLKKELKLPVVGRSSTHTSGKYFPRNIHEEKPTEK